MSSLASAKDPVASTAKRSGVSAERSGAPAQRRAAGAPAWPAMLAARCGLLALVGGGTWIAMGAAGNDSIVDTASASEPSWLAGPLHGLAPALSDNAFSAALVAMLGGYAVVVALAERLDARLLVGAIAATTVMLTLAPPILSSDIFGYVAYGHLGVLHGLNPYTHGPIAAARDPVDALVYWQHPASPYGPLFTLASYGLAHASLTAAVWTLKALAAVGFLAALAFTWVAAAGPPYAAASRSAATSWSATASRSAAGFRPAAGFRSAAPSPSAAGSRLRAVALVGANPLLLVYGVGGGHNDLLVLAAMTGAIALIAARRTAAGGTALVGAVAIKVTAGLALPFALLAGPGRQRRSLAIAVAGTGAVAAAITLAVFGPHVLDTPVRIVTRDSFSVAYSGPDVAARLLGTGISVGIRAVGAALVAIVALVFMRRVLRGGDWLVAAGATTLAVLVTIPSFVPWYIAWLLPFAALGSSARLRWAALALTSLVVFVHLPVLGFGAYQ